MLCTLYLANFRNGQSTHYISGQVHVNIYVHYYTKVFFIPHSYWVDIYISPGNNYQIKVENIFIIQYYWKHIIWVIDYVLEYSVHFCYIRSQSTNQNIRFSCIGSALTIKHHTSFLFTYIVELIFCITSALSHFVFSCQNVHIKFLM